MSRVPLALAAALASTALLAAGCGNGSTPVAGDPAPSSPSTSPSASSAASPEASPTASPSDSPTLEPGNYPDFAPTDYTYVLVAACFCPDGGVPIRITVRDDEAVAAVYARKGRGVQKGAPAEDYRRITIDDVIDVANDPANDSVDVDWPAGQDYPNSVYADPDRRMADEEIGYEISDVEVAS